MSIGTAASPQTADDSLAAAHATRPVLSRRLVSLAFALAVGATLVTQWLTPHWNDASTAAPLLEDTIPRQFGSWRTLTDNSVQVSVAEGTEQPYDQTLLRTYTNNAGDTVMLALAWGQHQRQDIKIHRPEVCYPAQGFSVVQLGAGAPIAVAGRSEPIPTTALLAKNRGELEAVRYWIRIGNSYDGDGLAARWYLLKEGFHGVVPDGMLVRASQRIKSADDLPRANDVMAGFLGELTRAVPAAALTMLVQ